MGIGALANLGISKGMSLGRELFGFLLRSDLNVAKIAEWAGITMDTLKDAPPEALSVILERAARSGAIDPREANNINIQLAKDAQEAMPAMPTLKAQDAANKLSKQFGVNFDVSNHPTAYGNSTYVSGRIPGLAAQCAHQRRLHLGARSHPKPPSVFSSLRSSIPTFS